MRRFFHSFFKEIRLKHTRYFYGSIVAIILLFFAAYIHNNNLAFILMFTIGAVGSVAIPVGRYNLWKVDFKVKGYGRPFAQREWEIIGVLKSGTPAYDIRIEEEVKVPFLKGEREVVWKKIPPHRGRYRIEEVEISSYYPLYLAKFFKRVKVGLEVVVYPTPKGVDLTHYFRIGEGFIGERGEFDGVREFREGDSLRDIHWGSVAKGTPMSKLYQIHSPTGRIVMDYDRLEGDKEARLSQLTKWVLEAEQLGIPFNLKLGNKTYFSGDGIGRILTFLALF